MKRETTNGTTPAEPITTPPPAYKRCNAFTCYRQDDGTCQLGAQCYEVLAAQEAASRAGHGAGPERGGSFTAQSYAPTPVETIALHAQFGAFLAEWRSVLREELAGFRSSLRQEVVEPLLEEMARHRSEGSAVGPAVGPEITVSTAPARHIGIVALQKRLGRGRTTIRDWYMAKAFPAPHYCGALRCWFLYEIEAWEEAHRPKADPTP